MDTIWLNGQLMPASDATVSALDRGVLWGQGLFETLRVYDGRPWAFEEHHARLVDGSAVLDVPVPAADALRAAMSAVIEANGSPDCGVRVTVTRGEGPPSPHLDATGAPNVIVTSWLLPDYTDLYRDGVDLVTMDGGGRAMAGIKSTSYGASVAGRIAARRRHADDVLFVGSGGAVYEATGSNVIVVDGSRLRTPPLGDDVLAGVTCAAVLDLARAEGFDVVEAPVTLDDLLTSDEVVLTSTLREVYPVRSIDTRPLRRGDTAARLRSIYVAAVRRGLRDL